MQGIPLSAAILTRLNLRPLIGPVNYQQRFIRYVDLLSIIAFAYTIILVIVSQETNGAGLFIFILRVFSSLVVYFLAIFYSLLVIKWHREVGYCISRTQSFIGASNNFELAIVMVVALYGAGSIQAFAVAVCSLMELPVFIELVHMLRGLEEWSRYV